MTKLELINNIAKLSHLSRSNVDLAVNVMLQRLMDELGAGRQVHIRGFGSFIIYKRSTMMGRNPKTGEALLIKSKHLVRFRSGKELKKRVNESSKQYPI